MQLLIGFSHGLKMPLKRWRVIFWLLRNYPKSIVPVSFLTWCMHIRTSWLLWTLGPSVEWPSNQCLVSEMGLRSKMGKWEGSTGPLPTMQGMLHELLSEHGSISAPNLPRMLKEGFGEPISTPAGLKLRDVLNDAENHGICQLEEREMPRGLVTSTLGTPTNATH